MSGSDTSTHSARELAVLSEAAYAAGDRDKINDILRTKGIDPNSYEILPQTNNDVLVVRRKGQSGTSVNEDVMVVVRGTDIGDNTGNRWGDVSEWPNILLDNKYSDRLEEVRAVYDRVRKAYPYNDVLFSGHSLGGWAAGTIARETGSRAVIFNPGTGVGAPFRGADENIDVYKTALDPASVMSAFSRDNVHIIGVKPGRGVHDIENFEDATDEELTKPLSTVSFSSQRDDEDENTDKGGIPRPDRLIDKVRDKFGDRFEEWKKGEVDRVNDAIRARNERGDLEEGYEEPDIFVDDEQENGLPENIRNEIELELTEYEAWGVDDEQKNELPENIRNEMDVELTEYEALETNLTERDLFRRKVELVKERATPRQYLKFLESDEVEEMVENAWEEESHGLSYEEYFENKFRVKELREQIRLDNIAQKDPEVVKERLLQEGRVDEYLELVEGGEFRRMPGESRYNWLSRLDEKYGTRFDQNVDMGGRKFSREESRLFKAKEKVVGDVNKVETFPDDPRNAGIEFFKTLQERKAQLESNPNFQFDKFQEPTMQQFLENMKESNNLFEAIWKTMPEGQTPGGLAMRQLMMEEAGRKFGPSWSTFSGFAGTMGAGAAGELIANQFHFKDNVGGKLSHIAVSASSGSLLYAGGAGLKEAGRLAVGGFGGVGEGFLTSAAAGLLEFGPAALAGLLTNYGMEKLMHHLLKNSKMSPAAQAALTSVVDGTVAGAVAGGVGGLASAAMGGIPLLAALGPAGWGVLSGMLIGALFSGVTAGVQALIAKRNQAKEWKQVMMEEEYREDHLGLDDAHLVDVDFTEEKQKELQKQVDELTAFMDKHAGENGPMTGVIEDLKRQLSNTSLGQIHELDHLPSADELEQLFTTTEMMMKFYIDKKKLGVVYRDKEYTKRELRKKRRRHEELEQDTISPEEYLLNEFTSGYNGFDKLYGMYQRFMDEFDENGWTDQFLSGYHDDEEWESYSQQVEALSLKLDMKRLGSETFYDFIHRLVEADAKQAQARQDYIDSHDDRDVASHVFFDDLQDVARSTLDYQDLRDEALNTLTSTNTPQTYSWLSSQGQNTDTGLSYSQSFTQY